MVERSRRGKGKRALMGSHNRCWLWGRNAVCETLRGGRWPVVELYLAETLPAEERSAAEQLAADLAVPVAVEPPERLARRCRSSEHQGYLARMSAFPYYSPEILREPTPGPSLWLILDGVQDPYNFGAILRSADVMGVDGVLVPERGQAEVNSLVARTSAGAVNHLRIARTPNLLADVARLLETGPMLVAASERADQDLCACDFRGPVAVVIGNEGRGIQEQLLRLCRTRVRVPHFGRVGSLNAAVAAGIVLYEIRRQRAQAD